ncbi:hypothetical protein EV702DRAFT_1206477 [Suillus placidus]|uniref:Uncharacterized protein n=1 Tax=Suillus placidus TaxID=48579 RepID=A0A9P6ZF89_9AGAM|nr:hypothetical protein EV702DRAFT_1206477 [Suillus placidus]
MAPAKKKGTRRAKVPRQNTIMGIPTPVTTGLPVLHMTDNGRFGLQDQLIPSGYVSSKPLPEPDLMTPVVQSGAGACTCGASCGASCGGACGGARGAVRGAVCKAARVAIRGAA